MRQYSTLAWRNLWRNKRRTFITLSSVLLAVLLAICMRSLQKGTYANMVANSVRFSTGYIQIHAHGYWNNPSVNNSFKQNDTIDNLLRGNRNVTLAVPRLESFLLLAYHNHLKSVEAVGISPHKEDEMSSLAKKIKQGKYLMENDNGILIGDETAKYLNLSISDTLTLLGQDFAGNKVTGRFPVAGIFHFPDRRINCGLVYIPLASAQQLLNTPGRCTSISIMLNDPGKLEATRKAIANSLDTRKWEVMTWQTMNKALTEEIAGDNAGGIIMLAILYMVVAFGVFGTILMMTVERRKEFAVMIALGMERVQLVFIIFFETLYIGLIGIITGIALTFPILFYFHANPIKITGDAAQTFEQLGIEPIMPASLDSSIFINQTVIVFVISLVAAIYPFFYVSRFKILTALR